MTTKPIPTCDRSAYAERITRDPGMVVTHTQEVFRELLDAFLEDPATSPTDVPKVLVIHVDVQPNAHYVTGQVGWDSPHPRPLVEVLGAEWTPDPLPGHEITVEANPADVRGNFPASLGIGPGYPADEPTERTLAEILDEVEAEVAKEPQDRSEILALGLEAEQAAPNQQARRYASDIAYFARYTKVGVRVSLGSVVRRVRTAAHLIGSPS